MHKSIILPVAVALFLTAVNLSFAGTTKPTKTDAPAASAAAELKSASGKILSIDNSKNEVVIELSNGKQKTFVIEAATLATLKAGERVHISYKFGDNHAQTVKVIETAKKK